MHLGLEKLMHLTNFGLNTLKLKQDHFRGSQQSCFCQLILNQLQLLSSHAALSLSYADNMLKLGSDLWLLSARSTTATERHELTGETIRLTIRKYHAAHTQSLVGLVTLHESYVYLLRLLDSVMGGYLLFTITYIPGLH